MKMEYGGGGGSKTGWVEMFRPGEMTAEVEKEVNNLLIPRTLPKTIRDKECALYQEFNEREIVFAYITGNYSTKKVAATCRLFYKKSFCEKLPIEYARITAITSSDPEIKPNLDNNGFFSVDRFPITMPVIEIGGLRAIKCDTNSDISLKARYRAIVAVITAAEKLAIEQGIEACFLTCLGSRELQKIYKEKFFFEEIAEIEYTEPQVWSGKALWRCPISEKKSRYLYS